MLCLKVATCKIVDETRLVYTHHVYIKNRACSFSGEEIILCKIQMERLKL